MRSNRSFVLGAGLLAIALTLTGLTGCATARATDDPDVTEMGEYVVKYEGPELEMVVGYRFASDNLGDEWLILDTAMTSAHGVVTTVNRNQVFIRTPGGDRIPLATQEAFGEAFGSLRPTLRKASINSDPLDYFPPNREECNEAFFTAPGEGIVYEELTLNDRKVCQGRFYFQVPGGVQPGRWVIGIDLEESDVRIAFDL